MISVAYMGNLANDDRHFKRESLAQGELNIILHK